MACFGLLSPLHSPHPPLSLFLSLSLSLSLFLSLSHIENSVKIKLFYVLVTLYDYIAKRGVNEEGAGRGEYFGKQKRGKLIGEKWLGAITFSLVLMRELETFQQYGELMNEFGG